MLEADGLELAHVAGEHGGDDRKQPLALLQGVVRVKGSVDAQGADHVAALFDRDAEKGELGRLFAAPARRAVEEAGLLADL